MVVNIRLKNKTHIAILCMSVATIIFVVHEMLATMNDPMLNQMTPDSKGNLEPQSQQWYQESDRKHNEREKDSIEEIAPKLPLPFPGEKLIHLDLKGAPPKISYYKELFPYLKSIGATGLLIEYEDMFPYWGKLKGIAAYNAYNVTQVKEIIALAEANNLTVVPLVQTFGHLEFVLKLTEFRELREVDRYPQVVCPTNPSTFGFLEEMVSQILSLHPKAKYLHIGSDEVYYIGQCSRCANIMNEKQWSKTQLFLDHVHRVGEMVQTRGVRAIMWDDEFRNAPEDLIAESGVDHLVDIMVWKYTPDVASAITPEILDKYSRVFQYVWIASAFKGATGPDKMVTDIRHHLMNHVSWMHIVSQWKDRIVFKGIAITGWQRYDHFAVLCELLPLGLPSLTLSLLYINGRSIHEKTLSSAFNCDLPLYRSQVLDSSLLDLAGSSTCSFPGSSVYHVVLRLVALLQDMTVEDVSRGWFTKYNIDHAFSSPAHVEAATIHLNRYMSELCSIEDEVRRVMPDVYDEYAIEEWLATQVTPLLNRIQRLRDARDMLLQLQTWPRRPLNTTALIETDAFPFT